MNKTTITIFEKTVKQHSGFELTRPKREKGKSATMKNYDYDYDKGWRWREKNKSN